MYAEHFGLREPPFAITPDTGYFMNRAGYQDALNVLLVALRSGEGFIKVTGEVGTGKTMLCRTLLNALPADHFLTAFVPNPYLQPETLLRTVADELGVPVAPAMDEHAFLRALTDRLVRVHDLGKQVVVCLDEVQAMPVATLERLRLLTNLETERSKLLQVVLFGQPELDELLAAPPVRQLRQRITFAYRLEPLNRVASEHYVDHRLAVAGHRGGELFSPAAMAALHGASRGIPRLLNILAHKAMMAAFGEGERRVLKAHVRRAVLDTEDARGWQGPGRRRPAAALARRLLGAAGLLGAVAAAGLALAGAGALLP